MNITITRCFENRTAIHVSKVTSAFTKLPCLEQQRLLQIFKSSCTCPSVSHLLSLCSFNNAERQAGKL